MSPRGDVRGTQSFVAVMARVWRHPSWTALELLWRWTFAALALTLLYRSGLRVWHSALTGPLIIGTTDLSALSIAEPAIAAGRLAQAGAYLAPLIWVQLRWLGPVLGALWVLVATVGRTLVLKRLDPQLSVRPLTQLLLGALRLAAMVTALSLWLQGLGWAAQTTLTDRIGHGREPNVLAFCAMAVVGTLLLFMVWSVVSWVLTAAPLCSLERGAGVGDSLRAALRLRGARARLIEINLVMGIVRVALVVLAMVFSACPLPFETVETRQFLEIWTAGVGVLWLLASDYFQVVRTAAYLLMLRAFGSTD